MPWEFWPLTPYEIAVLISGGVERETREWERVAWQSALLLNVSGKTLRDDVTPAQLLGKKEPFKVIDPGAKEAELQSRLEAMGLEKGE